MRFNPGVKRAATLSGLGVSAIALVAGGALAAPPPADTVIGNQAAATYTSNGETFTVQSNLVETVVNEVFDVTLSTDQTRDGAPGSLVFFPHTIDNDSNTDEVFDLASDAAGGTDDFPLTELEIFPDRDQDGVPDSLTPISETPAILAGESYGVVVRATVPSTAAPSEVTDFTVTATSQSDPSVTQTNTDIVSITTDGIIDLLKDQSLSVDADGDGQVSLGDTIEVTLTYSNTGIGAATGVIITDDLPTTNKAGDPVTLDYVAGSGVWSDNPGVALTDASGNTEATNAQGTSLQYETTGATSVIATLDTLAPGRSGTISFEYEITSALQGTIENTATVESDTQAQTSSNPSPVSVDPSADLVMADAAATGSTPASGVDGANLDSSDASASDDDGASDDVTTESADVFAGESMVFDMVVTNLGNESDTVLLDIANNDFPVGTSFDFVAPDGITPIVGDRIELTSGSSAHVQVVASLPSDAPATGAPAGFDATVTATSRKDSGVTNTTGILFNGAVVAPPVDLVNTDGAGTVTGGVGNGAVDDGGDPWQTRTVRPGETAVFPLQVSVDAGAPANTFDLVASGDANFATIDLPDGWSVEFYDTSGVKITSTGALSPTASAPAVFDYEARVSVPADAGADAVGTGLYFRAESPVNGASDTKLDSVAVEEVVDVAIEADTVAQSAPGGVAIVPHTITNLGNSTLTGGELSVGDSDPFSGQGITAAAFYDANDDGVLDANDPLITDLSQIVGSDSVAGLSPGEQARVFVRAQVPSTASYGIQETGDLTLSDSLTTENGAATDEDTANNTVLDTITIISGDMVITKEQAVDADCDGTPEGSYSLNALSADPGNCIAYRLIADNTGTSDANDVVINDTVPGFTTLEHCPADACAPALTIDGAVGTVDIAPADEGTGSVASSAQNAGFSLSPGSRAVLTFSVEIDT
ncbi:MAG: DUF11 domain-containing protein [Alphaproteobacteria bacterium]|jgi:uncharacterized repeat protein (TIGR01451 family)|nr:DUF11 domain-containing protein [Alphaproteobacteria bacterium]